MNRTQFMSMVKDVKENPARLQDYRKTFVNVYPFSDGVFKLLMANEAKPERTIMFLNAMLGLSGPDEIKSFTLGVQENPGVLNDKTAIFDIYGTTQAGTPILIEVQQNYNKLFVDRLIYYTSRVVSRTVKKSQSYDLPHIYVLSILTEDQFVLEKDRYFHHTQVVRNRHFPYEKLDVYFVELEKFFAIEDRTPTAKREQSKRADMLRLFRDVLEDKEIPVEKLAGLLDSGFAKDVSLGAYTDEVLLLEVDGMTDMLYEKQGSYLQGKEDGLQEAEKKLQEAEQKHLNERLEAAREMLAEGLSKETVCRIQKLTEAQVQAL
ncbi:MAG: Rpn family recombination-promoting nuclease/putative transposase [Fibrobacter sp.]|nr:Rpn family recombination-promoting nuclease/putative transposase [Fibrobacter sp.]